MNHDFGIGATNDLSLRVSVAILARVLFENPTSVELLLALERKATLLATENGRAFEVKCQPFGGAISIRDLRALRNRIGDFHFDSERSRSAQDFRIFIRPSDWENVREFCIRHLGAADDPIFETDPERELAEEFWDALKIGLKPDQYVHKPVATVVENDPAPTENIHARGMLTARVYRIFEATISDSSLAQTMLTNSQSISKEDLCDLALKDAQNGGMGRANSILALPLKSISAFYSAMPSTERNDPVTFEQHRLDDSVPAILENIAVPKYQRL